MPQQQYLTDKEIQEFMDDLDKDGNGNIDYWEVERSLTTFTRSSRQKRNLITSTIHHEATELDTSSSGL
jgi:Ca2+-binding EF-hand superfamily protein